MAAIDVMLKNKHRLDVDVEKQRKLDVDARIYTTCGCAVRNEYFGTWAGR